MDNISNMSSILFMLQNTLVGYYKTGHIIIDMIITFLIVTVCQKIISGNYNIRDIFSYLRWEKKFKSEYIIGAKVVNTDYGNNTYIPIEFKAVMFIMNVIKTKIRSARQYSHITGITCSNNYPYVINDTHPIQINDDIWIKQLNKTDKSADNKTETESFHLHVFSYTLSFNELRDTIVKWVKEYDSYLRALDADNKIYYYSYFGSTNKNQDLIFDRAVFNSNKTFDNIFFDQKKELQERLENFLNGKKKYERLGTPYTFGLLFYGEPGCGKTSTIKAIANYTKRHIISIPLSRVETCREFTKIFTDDFIMGTYIPIQSRIYVFEDIDCMSDIIIDRDKIKEDKENKEKYDAKRVLLCVKDTESKDTDSVSVVNKKDKDKLTLSYILNMVDGVLEQSDRIIIMTTNKPDNLDRALLRPGRIDMKINFAKSSIDTVKQIFNFFFNHEMKNSDFETYNSSTSNNKLTPAEIFEICHSNSEYFTAIDVMNNKIKFIDRNNNNTH